MTREQFQRIALVTIVVLLATLASNRLMAYSFGHDNDRHHRIVDVRFDHLEHWDEVDFDFDFDFDMERDNDRCRFDLDRLRADANRMRAEAQRIQREVQVEQRQLSQEAEQMRRMIRVEVN